MWANAQRDGRPAEYRWRPLFNAAVWLTPTTRNQQRPSRWALAHISSWLRGPAVEHWSLADVLSLSCARLVADG